MERAYGEGKRVKRVKRVNTHGIKLNLEPQRSHYSLVLDLCIGKKAIPHCEKRLFFYSKSLILRAPILKIMAL